jgi:hypothetical protein
MAVYSWHGTHKSLPHDSTLVLFIFILEDTTGGGMFKLITGKCQDSLLAHSEEKNIC